MTPEEQKKAAQEALNLLNEQARLQEQVSGSYDDFIKGVKKYKAMQEAINRNLKLEQQLKDSISSLSGDDKEIAKIKLELLEKQTKEMQKQGLALKQALVEANKLNLTTSKIAGNLAKGFVKLPGLIEQGFGKLKGLGLFEMEKAIKMSALQMGVLSKESVGFRSNIVNAAKQTNMIGVGVKDLAQIQSTYSDEVGRSVVLSEKGLVALGQMAASTVLGAEGAARMAAEMENQGVSAERTGKFVEQTLNDSSKMGLNASKVIKNVSNNIKMLNKYNFKEGVKGLAKMAMTVSKMGVGMDFAANMADKLFSIEGAVDMSAQLQVMGGEWAKMADPFRLMYMARNDMEGLTEELGNAAAASAKFNKKTGEFDLGAQEMHRLKIIAEQTGVAYDDLVTAGKNVAKLNKIKGQVQFSMSDEEKEFISNKATLNEKGEGSIMINGSPKLLKQLTEQDRQILKTQMAEQQSMKERAEQSRTFDESFADLVNQLKIYLLPLVDTMNKNLVPGLMRLADKFETEGWGAKIEAFASTVGELVTGLAGWIIDNPIKSGIALLTAKLAPTLLSIGGMFWDTIKWFKNGMQLGMGFNSVASVGGGGGGITDMLPGGKKMGFGGKMMKGLSNVFGGKNTMLGRGLRSATASSITGKGAFGVAGKMGGGMSLGKSLLKGGKAFTGLGAVSLAADLGRGMMDDPNSDLGKTIGIAGKAAEWASYGALLGSVVPGLGTAVGGAIGGVAGGIKGLFDEYFSDEAKGKGVHDGIFGGMSGGAAGALMGSAFGGIGSMVGAGLGSMFSEGRGVIQGGKITPIDNKDDLLAMKPGGAIDKAVSSGGSSMTINFGEIKINGEVKVSVPGNDGFSIDLAKDPKFQREITRLVHNETSKVINGGKIKV
jgi:hypothetical protein